MLRSVLSITLLLSVGVARADTIVVFGDSISAAYGLEVQEGWVALLQKRLQQEMPGKHQLINASLSGETTSGGLSRLPGVLSQYKPDILVLELGGNDGLRGQPPKLITQNLSAMIRDARQSGAQVLLLGMKIPPNYGKAYTQAFEQSYLQVSRESKVSTVPFLLDGIGGKPELMQDDGLHPNAKAQQRLLENVWPALASELKRPRASHKKTGA